MVKKTIIATIGIATISYANDIPNSFTNKPLIEQIIRQSANLKTNITAQNGSNIYTATYNGNDGKCDYVSVIINIEHFKDYQRIENFKVCENKIVYGGPTINQFVNQENINKISNKIAQECKIYGESTYYDTSTKTTITCKVKDLNRRFFEISIFDENMKLINKKVIDTNH